MKKNVIVFGLAAGFVVSITMSIGMITASKNPNAEHGNVSMMIGYLSMLVAFSLIYVAVKNYRDKKNNGVVSFGKAFLIGLLISLIASTMYVVTWAFLYHFYLPDFMDKYTSQMLEAAKATSTPAQLAEKTKEMNNYKELYKSPVFFTLMTYAEILPVGLLVSIITALLLKKKA